MLISLFIKNFALIDELEIKWGKNLTIITGQTGAGKSIIIGALNLVLGERADTEFIRQGEDKAVVEAIFNMINNDKIHAQLKEQNIEFGDELILRREVKSTGSRAFINDTPVTIAVLKAIGDHLVDLHGQHDHQLLLKEEHHIQFIDQIESVKSPLIAYKEEFFKCKEIDALLKKRVKQENEAKEKLELRRFQYRELVEAGIYSEELDELLQEMKKLDNAEILYQKAELIAQIGSESEITVTDLLKKIKQAIDDLSEIEPEFELYKQEIETALISVNETLSFTLRYRSGIEFNPARLEELRQRHTELKRIQKKYNRTIDELIGYRDELEIMIQKSESSDKEIKLLTQSFEENKKRLSELAVNLREARIKAGNTLAEEIVSNLKHLGIKHAFFQVKIEPVFKDNGWITIDKQHIEATENGSDYIRFYLSTNKGESPKSLHKIASGGEISRVMLVMKSILAREQGLPVMIFDEIDSGISGEISEKVGLMMRKLSKNCQIIAITHQPQIAGQAHHHYKVMKVEEEERTQTKIVKLDNNSHIKEVAALMSGAAISEASIESARELINRAGS